MSEETPEYVAAAPLANRLALAVADMRDAVRYLDAYDDYVGARPGPFAFEVREALVIAAVVAYCRCFKKSSNEPRVARRVSKADLPETFKQPDVAAFHDFIVSRRDTVIAHSDAEYRRTELLNNTDGSLRSVNIPIVATDIDVAKLRRLADAVQGECISRMVDLDRLASNAQTRAAERSPST